MYKHFDRADIRFAVIVLLVNEQVNVRTLAIGSGWLDDVPTDLRCCQPIKIFMLYEMADERTALRPKEG